MTATVYTEMNHPTGLGVILPAGHFSYGAPARTQQAEKDLSPASLRRKKVVAAFTRLTLGVKILVTMAFFLVCLALPLTASFYAFTSVSESPPVETVRSQEVPTTPLIAFTPHKNN